MVTAGKLIQALPIPKDEHPTRARVSQPMTKYLVGSLLTKVAKAGAHGSFMHHSLFRDSFKLDLSLIEARNFCPATSSHCIAAPTL
jgi:hypothetical protein